MSYICYNFCFIASRDFCNRDFQTLKFYAMYTVFCLSLYVCIFCRGVHVISAHIDKRVRFWDLRYVKNEHLLHWTYFQVSVCACRAGHPFPLVLRYLHLICPPSLFPAPPLSPSRSLPLHYTSTKLISLSIYSL